MPGDPFVIDAPAATPLRRAALGAVRPIISWGLRVDALARLYRSLPREGDVSFEDTVLRALDIGTRCPAGDLATVPRQGPLVIAANHPHGALDGLVLASLLAQVRSDVRLLANYLLARIPELHASCFFVDPFERPEAVARNRAGLRAAHVWLKQGGALVVFPAGEVAHRRDTEGVPIDPEWHQTVGRLALRTGARLLPAHITGSNSALFYAAGRLHPLVRTALLGREFLRAGGSRVEVRVGTPLASPARVEGAGDARALTAQARAAMERLAGGDREEADPAVDISAELSSLSPEYCLVRSGAYRVYCAPSPEIPATLLEIGRLRAISYRAAGEGTDSPVDLDSFDDHYLHLFSWDSDTRRIVGAYRLGRTDTITETHGVGGLYTRTLFRYDRQFLDRLSPALELGRSFVRPEYQRNHTAMFLLWKGIGRFVVLHPEYRVLFGSVSISKRYADSSRELLRAFLQQNHFDASLGQLVAPLNPPGPPVAAGAVLPGSTAEANRLISTIESDGKGMPVLLRQYLKLGAQLIGFNVDRAFGDVLDALMTVDLAAVDRSILGRYMGRDAAAAFLAHHAKPGASSPAARPRLTDVRPKAEPAAPGMD